MSDVFRQAPFAKEGIRALTAALLILVLHLFAPDESSAITGTTLALGGVSGSSTVYNTGSTTPQPNALVLAWVASTKASALESPTLQGHGLNWVKIDSISYSTINQPNITLTLFRAMGATPTSESVTIRFASASQASCTWVIVQFTGVDNAGVDGDGAIRQWKTYSHDSVNATFSVSFTNPTVGANAAAAGFANSSGSSVGMTPGVGFTGTADAVTGSEAVCLMAEWKQPGSQTVTAVNKSSYHTGGIMVEIVAAKTTLFDDSDPNDAALAPGGPATLADSFTFQTSIGSTSITDVTVSVPAGTSAGIGKIEILDDSTPPTVIGSSENPGDTTKVTLAPPIAVTTTMTSAYKIRITPKSHAAMPAPQGGSYGVRPSISDWTDENNHAGADSGALITIDNLSPANVSSASVAPWDASANLSWSNPADADLANVMVLYRAGAAVADTPTEGITYDVGNSIGSSTVGCFASSAATSCSAPGLTNTVTYYFKIFTRDSNGNWSANGVAPPLPATPQHYQPDAMIKLTSDGTFLSNDSYETTASSQSKSQQLSTGKIATYDLRFQNDGSTTDNLVITGTGSGSNFTVQYLDEGGVDRTAAVTPPAAGYTISGLAVGGFRDWSLNVKPNGGTTPVAGGTSYTVFATATSANRSISVDQVKAVTTSSSANITLVKSSDKTTCIPGEEITYSTVASNPASLSAASSVAVIDTIPANTGFKIDGAVFDPGTSGQSCTITFTNTYPNGTFTYTPISGGCGAPAGYDFCVKQVKWSLPAMPAGTNFTVSTTVRVK